MSDQCKDRIKITFIGDVMCDKTMADSLELYRNESDGEIDFHSVFSPMQGLFSQSSYVIANLETPISRTSENLTNKDFQFCSAYEFAEALYDAGVHFVSTANNHCLDRGVEGIISTIKSLNDIGFSHTGVFSSNSEQKPSIIEIDGIRVGILSYTYGTNAKENGHYLPFCKRKVVNLLQEQEGALSFDFLNPIKWYIKIRPTGRVENSYNRLIAKIFPARANRQWWEKQSFGAYRRYLIKKNLRFLQSSGVALSIMLLHIGGQYNTIPTAFSHKTVKWLLSNGVNIVIGNHEHVIQQSAPMFDNNQFCTYSLGNFLGSTGTAKAPYNLRAEYSIALHLYIDCTTYQIMDSTFSVLKTVYTNIGKFEVWPVFDLLATLSGEEKDKVANNSLLAAQDFSGKKYPEIVNEFTL